MMSDLRRKNSMGVVEKAHLRTDTEKFGEEHERIFGVTPSPFCDKCDKRHSFCECHLPKEIIDIIKFKRNK